MPLRFAFVFLLSLMLCVPARADVFAVTLDPEARDQPATGRIILFFVREVPQPRFHLRLQPIDAPFFHDPQPIASIPVTDFKPGETIEIKGDMQHAFPDSPDKLEGKFCVQAVLDVDQTERSHAQGPGNAYSDEVQIELHADRHDVVKLTLNHRVGPYDPQEKAANLKWVSLRSEMLSAFYGRDVYHRAGVALPLGYLDPNHPRRDWPAIYVVPGFGGRMEEAAEWALTLMTPGVPEIAPIGVFIVLDPEAPLGHHGFVDSANNGPRATALIKEFIPYLESQFRLVRKPEARIITGHSSGGWASLWLQLNYPDVFGGCWSSAPDPIDFSAFQMTDLYADANLYQDAQGNPTPSYREWIGLGQMGVKMTVRQECMMECAIDPNGCSGQQWDAWEAMFSPRDEATGLPKPLFDPISGEIDRQVAQAWSKFDICRMVAGDWNRFGPIVLNKVRLACGEQDSYYLNRAVERFKQKVDALRGQTPFDAGYIWLVPRATHNTIVAETTQRWNTEMREHFQRHGLQDLD